MYAVNTNKNKINNSSKNRSIAKYLLIILPVAFLIIGACVFFYNNQSEGSDTINAKSPNKSSISNPSDTPNEVADNATSDQSSDKTVAGSGASSDTITVTSQPTGSFVSNHKPSLSGKDGVPSSMQSACNTNPGATCTIRFVKDNTVKTLPAKIADSYGVVLWDWDVNKSGFEVGSWQIIAVASGGGQEKTTTDSINLEVQP